MTRPAEKEKASTRPLYVAMGWWWDDDGGALVILENRDLPSLLKDLCEHLDAGREDYAWGCALPGWARKRTATLKRVKSRAINAREGFDDLNPYITGTGEVTWVESTTRDSSEN